MRPKHITSLAWAVREAENWRGLHTGGPSIDWFEKEIAKAKEALKVLRAEHKAVKPKPSIKESSNDR